MALISLLCAALFQPFVLLFVSYRTVRSNFLIHTFFCFIVLVGSGVEGIPDFSLPVEVLKKIFSNIYIDYNKVDVLIYEPLVVFKFGDIQILIRRSDSWED